MDLYRRRIERDLDRWRERGFIGESGLREIRADLASRPPSVRLQDVLAVLGAVLFVMAASAFVAANWDAITRPAKLGLLLGALWLAYGVSALFYARGAAMAGQAAALVGVGLFGVDIMLIGQMYHLAGDPTDALLVWAVGALATGVILKGPAILVFAAGLAGFWSEWIAIEAWAVHWPGLAAIAALAAAFWFVRWRGGFHVIALMLSYFVLALGFRLDDGPVFLPVFGLGLAAMAVGLVAGGRPDLDARIDHRGRATLVYGFLVAFGGLLLHQTFQDSDVQGLAAFGPLAVLGLGFLVGVLWLAASRDHGTLLAWTYGALVMELGLIYVRTLGTLLETALFFLLAGVFIAGLAWMASRIRKERTAEVAS